MTDWHVVSMGVNGDLPEGMTLKVVDVPLTPAPTDYEVKRVEAFVPGQRWPIATLAVKGDGQTWQITGVNTDAPYQRQGVATAMVEYARQHLGEVVHSTALTEDGSAWADHVGSWKPLSKTAALISKHSSVFASHFIRLAWRIEAGKIDKLAEKAKAVLMKRPDMQDWLQRNEGTDQPAKLKNFLDKMPSEAFKTLPWMWTQIKADPDVLANAGKQLNMYQIGTAFHELRQNNKPTPDIHQMDYEAAKHWLGEVQPILEEMRPVPWQDPKHIHGLSDGRHVVHQITNADDASREGEMMGHCVGGYGSQIESGSTNIFSLRDEKHRPHVTMELQPAEQHKAWTMGLGDRVTDLQGRIVGQVVESPDGATKVKIKPDDPAMAHLVPDDQREPDGIWVDRYGLVKEVPGRYHRGDMVIVSPHITDQETNGDPGPYPIARVIPPEGGGDPHYAIDFSGAGGRSSYFLPDHSITSLADGTVPDKPKQPNSDRELPTHHRVTQVFGKGDQAPIGKYRKMVREFFDHMRNSGHTLEWAGNEFLPDKVDSLDDAEEVYTFLNELDDHMREQAAEGNEQGIDPLGMAHSLIESGGMAHQYGFDVDPEVMQVDWKKLMDDFVQKLEDHSQSDGYGMDDPDDAAEWIMAVARVKGVDRSQIRKILNEAENRLSDASNEFHDRQLSDAEDDSWTSINDNAQQHLREMMDDHARNNGMRIDHDDEELYEPEWLDEHGDPLVDEDGANIHSYEAADNYRSFKGDHEQDAEDAARESFREDFEPYHSFNREPFDNVRQNLLSGVEGEAERLIEMATNPSVSDAAVNNQWGILTDTVGNKQPFYAEKTNSPQNQIRKAIQIVQQKINASHETHGWQQVMPKGEEPLRDTSERTEQVIEALTKLERVSDKFPGTKAPGMYAVREFMQQHSLHEPFHSQAPGNATPKTDALRKQYQAPAQRDLLVDQASDQVRPQATFKDVTGQGLLKGDVVQHERYGQGTILNTHSGDTPYMTVEYPGHGRYNFSTPEGVLAAGLRRVGSVQLNSGDIATHNGRKVIVLQAPEAYGDVMVKAVGGEPFFVPRATLTDIRPSKKDEWTVQRPVTIEKPQQMGLMPQPHRDPTLGWAS